MGMNFEKATLVPGLRVFGRAVTFTPSGGSPVGRRGIFDREHEIIKSDVDGAQYSTTSPILSIRRSEWPELPRTGPLPNATIAIDDEVFRIFDCQPDSEGGSMIILKKVVS